jgi:hypothetical protein
MRHLVFGHRAHFGQRRPATIAAASSLPQQTGIGVQARGRTRVDDMKFRRPGSTVSDTDTVSASSAPGTGSDWDLAFAYEALARAQAVAGDAGLAREFTDRALAATEDIADDEDRDLVLADLETIPGQPRYW